MKRTATLILLLLMLMIGAPGFAQEGAIIPHEDRTDPVALVASYYNAINLKDYARAYGYWENVPGNQTLAQFTTGFAQTGRIAAFTKLPVLVEGAAGNLYASVPVALVAEQSDGTPQFFSGCIVAHRVNVPVGNATEPDPNWSLYDAEIRSAPRFDLEMLNDSCPVDWSGAAEIDSRYSAVDALATYYDAINDMDYTRAYAVWGSSPEQTYAQFVAGFAGTTDVEVILRLDFLVGAAAGSAYADLPVLLFSKDDGVNQTFTGCFTLRKSNVPVGNAPEPDPNWSLYDARVTQVTTIPSGLDLLADVCER